MRGDLLNFDLLRRDPFSSPFRVSGQRARSRGQAWPIDRISIKSTRGPVSIEILSIRTSKLITIRQVKAARALLSWSQSDLARHSGISEPTVARLESADGELGGRGETVRKIRAALEASGIEFIEENGTGEGVRFRKPRRSGGK
jgi:DNA-binding transcriptional regulator YiaG